MFARIHADYLPYYRSWCHDVPIVISTERDREIHRLQQLLYRSCVFYAEHYADYLDVIDYDKKVSELLDYVQRLPFHAGTFRPDYVIEEDGSIRVCEITSRFFGNGYFMSYFMEAAGEGFAKEAHITDRKTYFDDFFAYMTELAKGYRKLTVIKSADKSDSIKLYVPFYQALGLETEILEAEEVEAWIEGMKGKLPKNMGVDEGKARLAGVEGKARLVGVEGKVAGDEAAADLPLVISALNQVDLLSFSMETLKTLADLGIHNDFRTIFLLHDKRFFYLFFQDGFTGRFLTEEETAFLRSHVIPTYLPGLDPQVWEDAKRNKDRYIMKHHCLGKSEKVYAGSLMSEQEWAGLFQPEQLSSMILQPFITQKRFQATWQGKPLEEYLSPSILCVDDQYFGTGLFRTSSCPVINQGDAHKIAPVITDQAELFKKQFGNCHEL